MNVPLAILVVVSAAVLAVLLMVAVRRRAGGPLLADVLLQAVASRGTISPQVDGRLRAVAR